jgi:hypothetical protein
MTENEKVQIVLLVAFFAVGILAVVWWVVNVLPKGFGPIRPASTGRRAGLCGSTPLVLHADLAEVLNRVLPTNTQLVVSRERWPRGERRRRRDPARSDRPASAR